MFVAPAAPSVSRSATRVPTWATHCRYPGRGWNWLPFVVDAEESLRLLDDMLDVSEFSVLLRVGGPVVRPAA